MVEKSPQVAPQAGNCDAGQDLVLARLQVDPPVSSSRWTLVRGQVQWSVPGAKESWLDRARRLRSGPVHCEAVIEALLPGERQPRAIAVAADGQFQAKFATSLPRPRAGRHKVHLALRWEHEQIAQSLPLFMPRPGATMGIIVLAEDPSGVQSAKGTGPSEISLSRVAEELAATLACPSGTTEQTTFYLGFRNHPAIGVSWADKWPTGLWIAAGDSAVPARAAGEHAQWASQLLELFEDELDMVIVADTGAHTLAVLRLIERLAGHENSLRAVCLSDIRPLARGVRRQSKTPPGVESLKKLPITVCRTIDDARRLAAKILGHSAEPSAAEPNHLVRRVRVVHHRVTRYPLVFCHGMVGYSVIRLRYVDLENYFVGVRESLSDRGFRVFMPQVGRTHGVGQRAEQLRHAIGRWTQEPVNIIAHSMGGLDPRHMITHLDMEDRVVSLTTIATPHHGTSLADWFVERFDEKIPFLRGLEHLGADVDGFRDLTRAACHSFNLLTPNSPKVRYFSYSAFQVPAKIPSSLRRSYALIAEAEGPNDGLVSEASAHWGEHIATLRADHCSLIGEEAPEYFDHMAMFMRIVEDLIRLGF